MHSSDSIDSIKAAIESSSLKGNFLIASSQLNDDFFSQAVIFIVEHNSHGAMGLIVNKPMDIPINELFDELEIEHAVLDDKLHSVVCGGPVKREAGMVLHPSVSLKEQWQSSLILENELSLTASPDVLNAIGAEEGPEQSLIALGYVGWEANQLEQEISEGSWFITPANKEVIFDLPFDKRWSRTIEGLGFRPEQLSYHIGHS